MAYSQYVTPLHGLVSSQLTTVYHASSSSAANIAEIYNMALGRTATNIPNTSRLDQDLHDDDVLDAFFLQALLRDCDTHTLSLNLPHHGLQRVRFEAALDARNYAMAGTGQEMWAHACAKCMKIWTGESDGKLCTFELYIWDASDSSVFSVQTTCLVAYVIVLL